MSWDIQRFERLATQFEMIEHNLSACQEPKQRRNLLRRLKVLLDQIDDIAAQQQPLLLDSKLDSEAPIYPPFRKMIH